MPNCTPNFTVTSTTDAFRKSHLTCESSLNEQRKSTTRSRCYRLVEVFLQVNQLDNKFIEHFMNLLSMCCLRKHEIFSTNHRSRSMCRHPAEFLSQPIAFCDFSSCTRSRAMRFRAQSPPAPRLPCKFSISHRCSAHRVVQFSSVEVSGSFHCCNNHPCSIPYCKRQVHLHRAFLVRCKSFQRSTTANVRILWCNRVKLARYPKRLLHATSSKLKRCNKHCHELCRCGTRNGRKRDICTCKSGSVDKGGNEILFSTPSTVFL